MLDFIRQPRHLIAADAGVAGLHTFYIARQLRFKRISRRRAELASLQTSADLHKKIS